MFTVYQKLSTQVGATNFLSQHPERRCLTAYLIGRASRIGTLVSVSAY
jgi:hypothetical protein